MKIQLLSAWEAVRTSFWFVPALMVTGAGGASFATIALDAVVTERWVSEREWVFAGGAEAAGSLLGAVAGSMITVAGLVFSLTLVAVSLTTSQFGPRLLRNLMRDAPTQLVLGTFVATFVYSVLVLRTIRPNGGSAFVPHLSVTLALGMAIASVGVLIYFIHHLATSVQANEVIARVTHDLFQGIDRLFPEEIGIGGRPAGPPPEGFDRDSQPVAAATDGYVQLIDADALMAAADQAGVILRVDLRPGEYVLAGRALATACPGTPVKDTTFTDRVRKAFVIGPQRTPTQDLEHVILQLVEIATRALSPGVNDPFTALACIDRLGSGLSRLARREPPSPYRYDERNELRVIAHPLEFATLVEAAFDQIRRASVTDLAVSIRLLETIGAVAPSTRRPEDRVALRRQADMTVRGVRQHSPEEEDLRRVQERYETAVRELDHAGGKREHPTGGGGVSGEGVPDGSR